MRHCYVFVEGVEREICWRNVEGGFLLFFDSSQILFQYSVSHNFLIKALITYIARGNVQNSVWHDICLFLDLDFSTFRSLNMFSLSATSWEILDRCFPFICCTSLIVIKSRLHIFKFSHNKVILKHFHLWWRYHLNFKRLQVGI